MAQSKHLTNGPFLKEFRENIGWTQDELAERSRVSKGTISKMENGKGASASNIRLVAEALEVSWKRLLLKPTLEPFDIEAAARDLTFEMRAALDGESSGSIALEIVQAIATVLGLTPECLGLTLWRNDQGLWISATVPVEMVHSLLRAFASGQLLNLNAGSVRCSIDVLRFPKDAADMPMTITPEPPGVPEPPYTTTLRDDVTHMVSRKWIVATSREDGSIDVSAVSSQ